VPGLIDYQPGLIPVSEAVALLQKAPPNWDNAGRIGPREQTAYPHLFQWIPSTLPIMGEVFLHPALFQK
jgi:hypothetical protein